MKEELINLWEQYMKWREENHRFEWAQELGDDLGSFMRWLKIFH